jgi:hypothetical protein
MCKDIFNLFYRLFRKDIFGDADEIELKLIHKQVLYLIILKLILLFHNIDILEW